MEKNVSKEEWVAMFKEIGLSEEQMMAWHRIFESRHAEVHAEFLMWLGIGDDEIRAIRKKCQGQA